MSTAYNRIAWCYESVKMLVFGKTLEQLQAEIIQRAAVSGRVLIVGGGTGKILDFLPPTVQVVYVEPSAKMLQRARKRAHPNVAFYEMDYAAFCANDPDNRYDRIIFPFVLDLLAMPDIQSWLAQAKAQLSEHGKLIVVDFDGDRLRHPGLLYRLMLFFFKLTTAHVPSAIYPFRSILMEQGWTEEKLLLKDRPVLFGGVYGFHGK